MTQIISPLVLDPQRPFKYSFQIPVNGAVNLERCINGVRISITGVMYPGIRSLKFKIEGHPKACLRLMGLSKDRFGEIDKIHIDGSGRTEQLVMIPVGVTTLLFM